MERIIEDQINGLLNIGFAPSEKTSLFRNVKHDDYVENMQRYLLSYGLNWVESPKLTNVQGLNDRGIDLIAEFREESYLVGFQIKSYNDIEKNDFSQKLWQQIGQSGSYDVDRLFIILCGDMTSQSQYQKVRGFIANIEQGNYPQITLISPEQAWQLNLDFSQPADPQLVHSRINRNINRFLQEIGRTQEVHTLYSLYANLKQLYVPPTEYGEIRQILDDHNIVFIVGSPHLGKTFTAVKLLYDLYQTGYQPVWMLGRITSEHHPRFSLQEAYRQQNIQDTFSFESVVKTGFASYLEDPFGRTELAELQFANSLLSINELLHLLARRSNVASLKPKIIITSRESIFRRAVELQPILSQYAVWLKAGNDNEEENQPVSYTFGQRAEIAMKYVHLYRPRWAEVSENSDADSIERVEYILSFAISYLWTPHGLQRFLYTSKDIDLLDIELLREQVIEAGSIPDSFATEIALLPFIQQLVFVVIYLTNYDKTTQDFWERSSRNRDQYYALAQSLGQTEDEATNNWQRILESYPNIVELIENNNKRSNITDHVRFAHPAYYTAVSNFLSAHPQILESIFDHIQSFLQTQPGIHLAQDILWLLPHWFQRRPAKEAQILNEYLSTNDFHLLLSIAEQYSIRLPFVQNEQMRSAIQSIVQHPLARGDNNMVRLVFVRAAHVVKTMPIEKRWKILLLGLDSNPTLINMAMHRPYDLVCRHYDTVPDDARNHLHHYLGSDKNARQVVGRSLGHYFDLLPQSLQQYAEDIATDNSFTAYIAQKELITGFIIGYGQYNKGAHHLIKIMANSDDQKTRAYLAGALVMVYERLDKDLHQIWNELVQGDNLHCMIAVAERVISLLSDETTFTSIQKNGLLDLALSCAESSSSAIRAEMLRILLESRTTSQSSVAVETSIQKLLFDEEEVVAAAALYWILNDTKLQDEYPERFQQLLENNSIYASLSKLLYFTNSQNMVSQNIETDLKDLRNTTSQFLFNAILFHVAAQHPFLQSDWKQWVEAQMGIEDEKDYIIRAGQRRQSDDDKSRPIFEPNWLINYEKSYQLAWYYPQKSYVNMSSGLQVIVKKLDELNLIFQFKRDWPDYLDC